MRNLKKFLALVLALMMTFSLMVTVNAAPATPADFDDVSIEDTSYAEAINVLSALGIFNGYDIDGTTIFNPKGNIKRSEVAAILYRVAANDADDSQVGIYTDYDQFTDVPSDAWYAGAVNYCANAELVIGVNDEQTLYAPHSNVTGYQVLAMVLRMLGYDANDEFRGTGWQIRTASYARTVGLTKNIKEGTLGQYATREMVAEIMFQALQADLVDYNMLRNYYPAIVLVEDNDTNQGNYTGVKLPVNSNLMYENYGIVGKKALDVALDKDDFGRPVEAWVKDSNDDTLAAGTLYILDDETLADDAAIVLPMTPVKVYDNAIDECHMTKDINNDNSIAWGAITEYLNGATVDGAMVSTADTTGAARSGWLDATHTTTKYIGATGRTTEIYKLDDTIYVNKTTGAAAADQDNPTAGTDVAVNQWVFVYVDTFLGVVGTPTAAIKDTAGHVIKPATVTVTVGNGAAGKATLTLDAEDGKYKGGELILVQTPNGADTKVDFVENPEKAPLYPIDVPNTTAEFDTGDDCVLYGDATEVENVTIQATVGAQDEKMGVIASDGKIYYASNTFLAARTLPDSGGSATNQTVVSSWYDIPNGSGNNDSDSPSAMNRGITNSMIGRTYNIVLDHHGYIIGMDEVTATSDSKVGIITGIDSKRIAAGKYVTTVEAFMDDNTTKTFDVVGFKGTAGLDTATDADLAYWASASDADSAWIVTIDPADGSTDASGEGSDGGYGAFIGIGSLVKFGEVTMSDGGRYWKIADYDDTANIAMADGTLPEYNVVLGQQAKDDFLTGRTWTLTDVYDDNADIGNAGTTDVASKLNDNSTIFVAEFEYNYNTNPGTNDGSNTNKSYQAYKGFKNVPTVVTEEANNMLFQEISDNAFLVYPKDASKNYIIKAQDKITVDDSYLILSRGATYADHSVYNVLKNGVETTLEVSNSNANVNADIEATMASNELLLVTGRNNKGYVTSVKTIDVAAGTDSVALANTAGFASSKIAKDSPAALASAATKAYSAGVLRVTAETANEAHYLTVADDVIVKIVNRDLRVCYDSTMSEAMQYANGIDKDTTPDGLLDSHDLVFELNEYGYVCALYVID